MLEEGITWDSFYANFIEHYIWYHAFPSPPYSAFCS